MWEPSGMVVGVGGGGGGKGFRGPSLNPTFVAAPNQAPMPCPIMTNCERKQMSCLVLKIGTFQR